MDKKMIVEKINKFKEFLNEALKKVRLGLYVLPEVILALASVGCSEAKADVVEGKPTASQTQVTNTPFKPTPTATPILTATPTATPEPTPVMTREEAMKKLNITSKEINSLASLIIFDCTLKDGTKKLFMVSEYFKVLNSGLNEVDCNNVLDDTPFATFTTNQGSIAQGDIINQVDVTLVPDFLQGATINQTYGLAEIPFIFGPEALPTSNPYFQMIYDAYQSYITNNDSSGFENMQNIFLNSTECATLLLDYVPAENMVWASDYIVGFVQETPKIK